MEKKVIVAGHICLDVTPVFPSGKMEKPEDILKPGKLIQMGEAQVHTGGAVANTGLAMKILGADVSLMGKVGKDAFGNIVMDILKSYGAQRGMVISPKDNTSYSVILAIPGVDRIFLHNPGANHSFCEKDIPQKALEEAALFHFGYPPIMRKMYEREGEELLTLMKRAKEAGVSTSLDMASVDETSEAALEDWKKILEKVMPYVDFFVPSVEELCYMLDKERFLEWQKRAGKRDITEALDIEKDVKPLAKQCMDMGAKVLLIKCGAPGMYYRTADAASLSRVGRKAGLDAAAWADREGFEKSYEPDCILSGTGAGDTSIGAFLTAMLKGCSLEECVSFAAATGACCVASYDALSGLKSLEELRGKIAAGWKKRE